MKKLFLYATVLLLISGMLYSCAKSPETVETEDRNYVTDINGDIVPSHSDVSASVLDALKFKTDENGRVYYDEPTVKTYTGIDVSVFQGEIDWQAVRDDGIDFAMLRAGFRGYGTSGKLNEDEMFEANYNGALSAGLKIGVYFFSQATTAEEAAEEAEYLLSIIDGCNITYPVVFDWEIIDYDDARTDGMTSDLISECALAFCRRVEDAGYKPMIYFNCETGYFNYNLSAVNDYHFWLAEYSGVPSFYYDYRIWQYTKTGSVDGIEGSVDLNISIIDYSNSQSLG